MTAQQTLKLFFEEKQLPSDVFFIDHNGETHIIESEMIQDMIVNQAPEHEQKQILDVIVKIDFQNGDVNHFLEHLAMSYVAIFTSWIFRYTVGFLPEASSLTMAYRGMMSVTMIRSLIQSKSRP